MILTIIDLNTGFRGFEMVLESTMLTSPGGLLHSGSGAQDEVEERGWRFAITAFWAWGYLRIC